MYGLARVRPGGLEPAEEPRRAFDDGARGVRLPAQHAHDVDGVLEFGASPHDARQTAIEHPRAIHVSAFQVAAWRFANAHVRRFDEVGDTRYLAIGESELERRKRALDGAACRVVNLAGSDGRSSAAESLRARRIQPGADWGNGAVRSGGRARPVHFGRSPSGKRR